MPTERKIDQPLLSVIVPAYRQQKTIEKDIQSINETLEKLTYPYEIIVVVDGTMIDDTYQNAKNLASSKIHIVGYPHNHGKGYAVRYGMSQSKGEIIAFMDAGMDIRPACLAQFLDIFTTQEADIVIGSKLHPDSHVSYPWQRKIMSCGYRTLVRLGFGLSVRDTQVGIKVFRRKVLQDVLPRLLVKAFAFDIEMLAVARHLGYNRIFEAPITLDFKKASSITSKNFWKIIFFMLWDTSAVFYRLRILHYYDTSNKRKWRYDPELNFRINVG